MVTIQTEQSEALVCIQPAYNADLVVIEEQVLQVRILLSPWDADDIVARVVDPLQICRWSEVESLTQAVVRGVQLYQVLDGAQAREGGKLVVWNIDILEVLEPLHSSNGNKFSIGYAETQEGMASVVVRLANLMQTWLEQSQVSFLFFLRLILQLLPWHFSNGT